MLVLKRDPNCRGDEFFLVHDGGKAVSRIFNPLAGASAPLREILDAMWLFNDKFERALSKFNQLGGRP